MTEPTPVETAPSSSRMKGIIVAIVSFLIGVGIALATPPILFGSAIQPHEALAASASATKKKAPKPSKPVAPKQSCHPSYSGCLDAKAKDYDCLGGKGDGPKYTGKVKVLGPDVFKLDSEKDGYGCE